MKNILFTVLLVVFTFTSNASEKGDRANINQVIDQYIMTEDAGDMKKQAKLMSKDRVWVGFGGRMTNQAMNMKIQLEQYKQAKLFMPDVEWFSDARDRLIKFYGKGNVAIASFYWYRTFVLPANAPLEKAKFYKQPSPAVVTIVLERDGKKWKMIHTHSSPMAPQN